MTVGIIGLGLIGGSLAKAMRRLQDLRMIGADADAMTATAVLEDGVIDQAVSLDPFDGRTFSGCDLVFLCVPPDQVVRLARLLAPLVPGLICDTAGIKRAILDVVDHDRFIGGHPMCGSDRSGYAFSRADLFVGAPFVLSLRPNQQVDLNSLEKLLRRIGAWPLRLSAERHDAAVASVSHLPHVAAAALSLAALADGSEPELAVRLAAGGFRDTTRIAGSSALLWTQLALANKEPLMEGIDALTERLRLFRTAIAEDDPAGLSALFAEAARRRRALDSGRFAVIGYPIGHSLSPWLHQNLLAAAGLSGSYEAIEVDPADFEQRVGSIMADYDGFNATIPHKQALAARLDHLDQAAAWIGSVNTVWRGNGYNTDLEAFAAECPIRHSDPVLLLGAGGVARTIAFAASRGGARLRIWARRPEQARALADDVRQRMPGADIDIWGDTDVEGGDVAASAVVDSRVKKRIIENPIVAEPEVALQSPARSVGRRWLAINATSAGMWPRTRACALPEHLWPMVGRVYDTVYNPIATRLVLQARSRGISAADGCGMLLLQAAAAQEIWHPGLRFSETALADVRGRMRREIVRRFPTHLLLSGFMGSGKSTVGRLLADRLSFAFVDLDERIEQRAGKTINAIFADDGEKAFRQRELEALDEVLGAAEAQIVALGGGALQSDQALARIDARPCLVFWLDVSLPTVRRRLAGADDRPLFNGQTEEQVRERYESRLARYAATADCRIDAEKPPLETAAEILTALGLDIPKREKGAIP